MSSNTNAAPADPIQLGNSDEFDDVVDNYDVVLVDFYADWCGPCKMMEPTIEALADETDAAVLKVDVDQFQALAGQYEVQGIPTLLVFADGEIAERMVGAQTGDALSQTIAGYTA
jgi:thioredoxin 1